MNELNQLFHDPNEKLLAVLGQGYITSIMQGDFSKSVMVLSDKRLYQKGKIFAYSPSGKLVSSKGEKVCSVKDITGTSYSEINHWASLVISIVCFAILLLSFISTKGWSRPMESTNIIELVVIGFCGLIFLLAYYTSRLRIFVVQHAGGAIATNARWYSPDELHDFQREISIIKDKTRLK